MNFNKIVIRKILLHYKLVNINYKTNFENNLLTKE